MRFVFLILLIAGPAFCTAIGNNDLEPHNSTSLSSKHPIAILSLGPVPDGPTTVLIKIGSVRNPEKHPVRIAVALTDKAGKMGPFQLSMISLFPADQRGDFLVRSTKATEILKRALKKSNPEAVLRLTLEKEGGGLPSNPEDVRLEGISALWMQEPRSH